MWSLRYSQLVAAILVELVVSFSPDNFENFANTANDRVIGGGIAERGQFPYQAALRINVTNRPTFSTCGGTLIALDFTLTAAHCVKISYVSHIEVHLGAYEISQSDEEGRVAVIVEPEGFFAHKDYDPTAIANDIALLKFPEKIQLTDRIKILSLPRRSDASINFEGKSVIASGWGRYSESISTISSVLKYMNVTVENQKICRHFYSNFEIVTDGNICTYSGLGDGVCNGDSGGPLAYTDGAGRSMVMGIASFVSDIGCVASGWPSVFVRVTHFLDWIQETSGLVIEP